MKGIQRHVERSIIDFQVTQRCSNNQGRPVFRRINGQALAPQVHAGLGLKRHDRRTVLQQKVYLGRTAHVFPVVQADARHRRQGIARRTLQTMLQWLAAQGIQRVTLHAAEVGRPLYAELGFVDSNEMQLKNRQ